MLTNWLTVAFLVSIMMLIKIFTLSPPPPTMCSSLPLLTLNMWACVIHIISRISPVNSTLENYDTHGDATLFFFFWRRGVGMDVVNLITLCFISENYIYFCCLFPLPLAHEPTFLYFNFQLRAWWQGCKSTCQHTLKLRRNEGFMAIRACRSLNKWNEKHKRKAKVVVENIFGWSWGSEGLCLGLCHCRGNFLSLFGWANMCLRLQLGNERIFTVIFFQMGLEIFL